MECVELAPAFRTRGKSAGKVFADGQGALQTLRDFPAMAKE
jgi:hypothetical protein